MLRFLDRTDALLNIAMIGAISIFVSGFALFMATL